MKKLSLLIAVFACSIVLQAQVPYVETITLDNYLNNPHNNSGLRSTSLSPDEHIIYQRSVGITNLPNFNLNRIDTASHAYFEQAITEIYQSGKEQLFTDYMGLRAKIGAQEEQLNTVNVGILNVKYDVLNYDEENPNNPNNAFTLVGYELQLINGKEPYTQCYTTVVSPLKNQVEGSNICFRFRSDLIFSNGKPIRTLTADLGDGITRNIIQNGNLTANEITVPFNQTTEAIQTYNITFGDGATLTTRSALNVYVPSSTLRSGHPNSTNFTNIVSDYEFKGYDEPNSLRGVLDYRVFYAGTDKVLRKPLLILDGFDPGDKRKIEQKDYKDPNDTIKNPIPIYKLMEYQWSVDEKRNLVLDLNAKGYDVVIVNFPSNRIRKTWVPDIWLLPWQFRFVDGGADYIERNSLTVATLIKKLNQEIRNNGSNEKLVIVGPSMGGQISRYALAWMEKNNIEHNTRLWLSFDSPHLGANIPIGMQSALYLMKKAGVAEGADKYNYMLKSPAAQQMLINQHKELGSHHYIDGAYMNGRLAENGFASNSGAPYFQTFYKAQAENGLPGSKGYPTKTRNLALVNGYSQGNIFGYDGEQTVNIRGYINLCWIFCRHIHAASFETYNQSNNHTARIARFKKAFNDKTTLSVPYDNKGNIDIISGGSFDSYDQIVEAFLQEGGKKKRFDVWTTLLGPVFGNLFNLKPYFEVNKNKNNHSFIPTVSALGFKNANFNWGTPVNNRDLVQTGEIPFDNYFTPSYNQEHVSLTAQSVSWLMAQLNGNYYSCMGEMKIFGDYQVCQESVYAIQNLVSGATVQWSVSNPSVASISNQGVLRITSSYVGGLQVKAAVTIYGQTIELSHDVIVRIPDFAISSISSCMQVNGQWGKHYLASPVNISQTVNPDQITYEWGYAPADNPSQYTFVQRYSNINYYDMQPFIPLSLGNYQIQLRVFIQGSYCMKTFTFNDSGCDGGYGYFSVYPNPASGMVTLSLNINYQDSKTTSEQVNKKNSTSQTYEIQLWSATAMLKHFTANSPNFQFSVTDLPKGIYFVRVIKDGEIYTQKLIRN